MLRSKIENAHWAEKKTTARYGIWETATTRNCVLWLFSNNHNSLWHETNSHNAKCILGEMFISLVTYWLKTNTCNVGLMKNNGKSRLFFPTAVRTTLRITLHIFRMTFTLPIDAVPLTVAAYRSLRTSRRCQWGWPEGTSCASNKLSAAVNSLRAYSRSSRPSFVSNR